MIVRIHMSDETCTTIAPAPAKPPVKAFFRITPKSGGPNFGCSDVLISNLRRRALAPGCILKQVRGDHCTKPETAQMDLNLNSQSNDKLAIVCVCGGGCRDRIYSSHSSVTHYQNVFCILREFPRVRQPMGIRVGHEVFPLSCIKFSWLSGCLLLWIGPLCLLG